MGICLGSQLIAKACQSKVEKAVQKEICFSTVQLTKEGKADPLFIGINGDTDVYQWHEDTFYIPERATRLATSKGSYNQAFRVGSCVYGLQFHIEITDLSIERWSDKYIKEHKECQSLKQEMLDDYQQKRNGFHQAAQCIYANFLNIIELRKVVIKNFLI